MTVVSVRVLHGESQIKTVERPVHAMEGGAFVTYKGKLYPLQNGNCIQIKGSAGERSMPSTRSETPAGGRSAHSSRTAKPIEWDPEQREVIEERPETRLLVDAGPGMGKTAVACARVAWLIDRCTLDPSEIWMVSFTRTAVHEMRNRIAAYLDNPAHAAGIRIATIDSHSWAIQSGFDAGAELGGGYEENIGRTIELIERNQGVFEYLSQVRHLFVDEAQDIVGQRVRLLLEIINALPQEAGVTIFSDEAQSIYGFAQRDDPDEIEGTLPDAVRKYMAENFYEIQLQNVHRTNDSVLRAVMSRGRKLLVNGNSSPERKLAKMQELVKERNHGLVGNYRDDLKTLPDDLCDAFLLFRRRGEALQASACLNGRPHRIRMSGLPPMLPEWIAVMFWDWTTAEMDGVQFSSRWAERIRDAQVAEGQAWGTLVRLVGITARRISVRKLVHRLASGAPPVELCLPDFGTDGPIVGTIHGAKGREADHVRLYVPGYGADPRDADKDRLLEEARILFVGASRSRKQLKVGKGASKAFPRRLPTTGRAFTPYPYKDGVPTARAMVEVGHQHDIACHGLTGKTFFHTQDQALAAQDRVAALSGAMVPLMAEQEGSTTHGNFVIVNDGDGGDPYAFLSHQVGRDLREVARLVDDMVRLGRLEPPLRIQHLRSFGVRTLAVAPDDPIRETLHSPWRDSGLMLAPLVLGYGMAYFRY